MDSGEGSFWRVRAESLGEGAVTAGEAQQPLPQTAPSAARPGTPRAPPSPRRPAPLSEAPVFAPRPGPGFPSANPRVAHPPPTPGPDGLPPQFGTLALYPPYSWGAENPPYSREGRSEGGRQEGTSSQRPLPGRRPPGTGGPFQRKRRCGRTREAGGRADRAPPGGSPESLTATRAPCLGAAGPAWRLPASRAAAAPAAHLASPPGKAGTAGGGGGAGRICDCCPAGTETPAWAGPGRGPAAAALSPPLGRSQAARLWPHSPPTLDLAVASLSRQSPRARWHGHDPGTWGPFLSRAKQGPWSQVFPLAVGKLHPRVRQPAPAPV
ncbi:translation initiation factor IF-2-like [Sturnira hondurensis]|uniref:translation initiation factor IF-2-like n=1 Tax=Sturnira hondurensis TaxID=192404 RepID=UPI00187ADAAC|nr:translation initiation factor IF-2-like [Sturnira hondurensis]